MTVQPAGQILDGLGVTFDLDDGDLVHSAIVISRVLCEDGSTSLCIGSSDGCGWLDQLGLVTAAGDLLRPSRWKGSNGTYSEDPDQ